MQSNYEEYMRIALDLAQKNLGTVLFKPVVGCVIVRDGKILSTGVTQPNGIHAEFIAIDKANNMNVDLTNATMFVTLEPCCHYGTTPPCTKKIISSGIKTVVVAIKDYNNLVNGGGIKDLQDNNITVFCDVLKEEARKINAGFFTAIATKKPLVTLKLAMTIDGKIIMPRNHPRYITNQKAIHRVHEQRAVNDAILVGGGTVSADDPMLNCRTPETQDRSPIRVVLGGKIDEKSKLFNTAMQYETWHIASKDYNLPNIKSFVLPTDEHSKIPVDDVLRLLCSQGINRLMVEGGARVASDFLMSNNIDVLYIYRASIIGGNNCGDAFIFPVVGVDNLNNYTLDCAYVIDDNVVEVYKKITNEFL